MTYLNIAGTQSNSELEKKGMNSASYDTFVELYKLYLEYQKLVTDDTAVQRLVKVMRSSTEEEIQRKINRYYPYLTKKQQAAFEKQFGKPAQ